mmetsp:Transcript_124387/g.265053  ORF Transcript_124387/g.265053 Transcript_124387/m.265053 type:complete len:269 (-) Transcript_124387:789-1595(-)
MTSPLASGMARTATDLQTTTYRSDWTATSSSSSSSSSSKSARSTSATSAATSGAAICAEATLGSTAFKGESTSCCIPLLDNDGFSSMFADAWMVRRVRLRTSRICASLADSCGASCVACNASLSFVSSRLLSCVVFVTRSGVRTGGTSSRSPWRGVLRCLAALRDCSSREGIARALGCSMTYCRTLCLSSGCTRSKTCNASNSVPPVTTSKKWRRPASAAMSTALLPCGETSWTEAFAFMRTTQLSKSPLEATCIRGVRPSRSLWFGS